MLPLPPPIYGPFEAYLAYLDTLGKPRNTIKSYRNDLAHFMVWWVSYIPVANREVTSITPQDIRDYKRFMLENRLAPGTINRRLSSLRAAFDWFMKEKAIPANPALEISGITEQTAPPHWLDRQEQNRLIRQLERDLQGANTINRVLTATRNKDMVIFLLHTGLRVSEFCALRFEDFELTGRAGTVKVLGKGDKVRTVPLNHTALKTIKPYCITPGLTGLIFEVTPRMLEKILAGVSLRAGIKPAVTPHTLRHTCAHNLVELGVSLDIIASILGHERLDTTRLYTQPGLADLTRALERMDP